MESIYDTLHPREATTGKFSEKTQSAPELALNGWPTDSPEVAVDVLRRAMAERPIAFRTPVGVSATRAALKNSRGESDNGVRVVNLNWDSVPPASANGDNLEVVGPKDGRPIIVHVPAGHPRLNVVSGYAIIVSDSAAGNSVKVSDGASASILAGARRKISTRAAAGSVVSLFCEDGTFGYQTVEEGALFTVHNRQERITLSTDPRP